MFARSWARRIVLLTQSLPLLSRRTLFDAASSFLHMAMTSNPLQNIHFKYIDCFMFAWPHIMLVQSGRKGRIGPRALEALLEKASWVRNWPGLAPNLHPSPWAHLFPTINALNVIDIDIYFF